MRFFLLLTASIPLALAAVVPRQATSTTIFKSGSAAWENLAVRPNGQLLVTRMDAGEVWTVDPATKAGSKLFTLSGVSSTSGITEVGRDIYAVVGGKYSDGRNTAGSYRVFKIDMTASPPTQSVLKMIPEATMFNGISTLNNDTVLVADGGEGAIYRLSMSTGEYSVATQDVTMTPPSSAPIPLGIDGMRYWNGSIYYTNIFKNAYYKIAVDATGKSTGSPTTIWSNQIADDLAIASDGTQYVAASGKMIKVTPEGKASTIASVASCTACNFGRGEKDKNTLYISTSSGSVVSIPVS